MEKVVIFILIIFLIGCNGKRLKDKKSVIERDSIQLDSTNTLNVKENCAILMWMDDKESVQMNNEAIMDNVFYTTNAEHLLDSLKIKNFRCTKKYMILKTRNQSEIICKKDTIYGMILFNVDKKPIVADIALLDTLLINNYFYK